MDFIRMTNLCEFDREMRKQGIPFRITNKGLPDKRYRIGKALAPYFDEIEPMKECY